MVICLFSMLVSFYSFSLNKPFIVISHQCAGLELRALLKSLPSCYRNSKQIIHSLINNHFPVHAQARYFDVILLYILIILTNCLRGCFFCNLDTIQVHLIAKEKFVKLNSTKNIIPLPCQFQFNALRYAPDIIYIYGVYLLKPTSQSKTTRNKGFILRRVVAAEFLYFSACH
jgi:hypothetical protein